MTYNSFEKLPTYKPWMKWRSENCDVCGKEGCGRYFKNYALAQTWGKDFTNELPCEEKL